jgi:hypothetical protein
VEYVNLRLLRELHCTPSALRRERATDILEILAMLRVETRVEQARKKVRHGIRH